FDHWRTNMNVFGIALITLLSFIGLGALITGFVVGETFFIVIGLLVFIMAFLVWLSIKDKVSNPFKD
ncbi:MAG: hypothetical protein RSA09_07630, partial [Acinetobacter sp.]